MKYSGRGSDVALVAQEDTHTHVLTHTNPSSYDPWVYEAFLNLIYSTNARQSGYPFSSCKVHVLIYGRKSLHINSKKTAVTRRRSRAGAEARSLTHGRHVESPQRGELEMKAQNERH